MEAPEGRDATDGSMHSTTLRRGHPDQRRGALALAIGYSLGNWTALTNFVDDGRIDAHNDTAERALRAVAIPTLLRAPM